MTIGRSTADTACKDAGLCFMTLTDTGLIMRNLLIALTLIATLAACGKDEQATQTQVPDSTETTQVAETAPEKSESERLNEWFELRFEEQVG